MLRRDPFFQIGHGKAKALLVCNSEARAIIPDKWSQKTQVFPVSGISSEDLEYKSMPRQNLGEFRILSAGSLIRIKGFSLTIRAFKTFSDGHPDAKLTIIGSGPEERTLQSLVQDLGLEDLVSLVPSVPRNQLLREIADCDVFLFPSLRDGGGTVVIEAMALGKPVVCLDTGGPGMHVSDECGIKIVPGTPSQTEKDLAKALDQLYVDENLRKSLGKAAKNKIINYYLWDRLGDRLAEIYQQAVANSSD